MTHTEYWGSTSLYTTHLTAVANYAAVLADSESTQQQIDDALQAVQDAAAAGAVANTPNVSVAYDVLGRQTAQSNGLATSEFIYDPDNLQIDTETITYTLPGAAPFVRVIDRSQDTLGRDTGFQLKTENSTLENSASYTYGTTDGRLSSVAGLSGSGSFQYGYTTNSNLVASITGPAHTVTNTWDSTRNVLDKKENKVGSCCAPN